MQNNFVGKHFLTLEDYTPEDLRYLLDLALRLKKEKKDHVDQRKCIGDNMLMLFEMESTRTRCAFETSAQDLGMGTAYPTPISEPKKPLKTPCGFSPQCMM